MENEAQKAYYIKVGAISTILMIVAIIIGIKTGKKFWMIVLYAILGSMLGSGIGYLIFKYPKEPALVDTSSGNTVVSMGYDPNRTGVDIKIG